MNKAKTIQDFKDSLPLNSQEMLLKIAKTFITNNPANDNNIMIMLCLEELEKRIK